MSPANEAYDRSPWPPLQPLCALLPPSIASLRRFRSASLRCWSFDIELPGSAVTGSVGEVASTLRCWSFDIDLLPGSAVTGSVGEVASTQSTSFVILGTYLSGPTMHASRTPSNSWICGVCFSSADSRATRATWKRAGVRCAVCGERYIYTHMSSKQQVKGAACVLTEAERGLVQTPKLDTLPKKNLGLKVSFTRTYYVGNGLLGSIWPEVTFVHLRSHRATILHVLHVRIKVRSFNVVWRNFQSKFIKVRSPPEVWIHLLNFFPPRFGEEVAACMGFRGHGWVARLRE